MPSNEPERPAARSTPGTTVPDGRSDLVTAAAPPDVLEDALDLAATQLAGRHALADGPPAAAPCWSEITAAVAWLARARTLLSDPEGHAAKAAEWLLDNEYVVQRAVLQIRQDLPAGFYRQLPALARPGSIRCSSAHSLTDNKGSGFRPAQ